MIDPSTQDITITFDYFHHTEPDYDETTVYVLAMNGAGTLLEEHLVDSFGGVIGSYTDPRAYSGYVPHGTLPTGTATIQVELRMTSDGRWSDEDGLWDTPCGPIGVDDVDITVGTSTDTYTFNSGA